MKKENNSNNKKSRLFVPLATGPFMDFKENGKRYELRKCEGNFSEGFVYEGRRVELCKGYKGEILSGTIRDVIIADSIEGIFDNVSHHLVEPKASTIEEAVRSNYALLGKADKYIAFMVEVRR